MKHETNDELRKLIKQHGLTRPQVRDATCSATTATVDRWLVPPMKKGSPNPTFRHMPPCKLQLLKVKLLTANSENFSRKC